MNTEQVTQVIIDSLDPKEWAAFKEMKMGAGLDKDVMQRFDVYAINYYRSKRYMTRCFEIKVSRSDFLSEMKKPLKRRAAVRLSNEMYFVAPKGLIKIEEIPVECGLLEVEENGNIIQTVPAPFRDIMPLPNSLIAAISRRADKGRLKEWLIENKPKVVNRTALAVLEEQIERYKNYNTGNKEVPDKIANALRDVYYEVQELLKINKDFDI